MLYYTVIQMILLVLTLIYTAFSAPISVTPYPTTTQATTIGSTTECQDGDVGDSGICYHDYCIDGKWGHGLVLSVECCQQQYYSGCDQILADAATTTTTIATTTTEPPTTLPTTTPYPTTTQATTIGSTTECQDGDVGDSGICYHDYCIDGKWGHGLVLSVECCQQQYYSGCDHILTDAATTTTTTTEPPTTLSTTTPYPTTTQATTIGSTTECQDGDLGDSGICYHDYCIDGKWGHGLVLSVECCQQQYYSGCDHILTDAATTTTTIATTTTEPPTALPTTTPHPTTIGSTTECQDGDLGDSGICYHDYCIDGKWEHGLVLSVECCQQQYYSGCDQILAG